MYVVTKLHMVIVYYVTWLCHLTQIFVSGFTDKLVCIDISCVDVDVWLCHADPMDPNLSLQLHFQKSNQHYVCMHIEFVPTVLRHYTDENILLW